MTPTPTTSIEIVAELAQGFEGNPGLARLLINAAAASGADAAKFQLVYADELATPDYKYYDLFKTLEMDDAIWSGLAADAVKAGIKLYLDVFGQRSLDLAARLGVTTVKLHGTDIANAGFLAQVAASSVPRVMLGAGGAHLTEVETALDLLRDKQVIVLLGFQSYPTPHEDNQIARVRALTERWKGSRGSVTLGFADHAPPEEGTRFALAGTAIGAGATLIEKHLTLGRNMKLEDHESALNPDEFEEFSHIVRNCASALGLTVTSDDFGMSEAEKGYRKMIRRHVVATRDLAVGTILLPEHLMLKRAGATDVITDLDLAYGKRLVRAVTKNAPVLSADLGNTQ
ncbi:sialic acid synthase SpsE [Devosia sp. UYZn731]|uniref:N-acetylneuraminate synthase family protein n=1 Tax=Devosia sp. UYZn731 TaxID=3156345 RepID=UPI0033981847